MYIYKNKENAVDKKDFARYVEELVRKQDIHTIKVLDEIVTQGRWEVEQRIESEASVHLMQAQLYNHSSAVLEDHERLSR